MKRIIYMLLVILIFGCQKENTLEAKLEYEHLYAIEDDPSDPVKHRVYEIYKQYNVPVYFNDTIGKLLVKEDIHGNPVYRYETLDLAWGFTSYSNLKFHYEYMTDSAEKLKALDLIEEYLKLANKALYPFNFFVVKSLRTEDNQENITEHSHGKFNIYFRTLLMTGDWSSIGEDVLLENMKREMVKNKIMNYKDLLSIFNGVSKKAWYGVSWISIDPKFNEYLVLPNEFEWKNNEIPPVYYFSTSCLSDTWYAVNEFTPVGLEKFRAAFRLKIGQFGFVSSGRLYLDTPNNTDSDLTGFINEMLRWSREEFREKWGDSPLVMKKYDILYEIVVNNLGVEL